ncbi:zf-CCHC domain-containing protein [Tanacetum coccineum]
MCACGSRLIEALAILEIVRQVKKVEEMIGVSWSLVQGEEEKRKTGDQVSKEQTKNSGYNFNLGHDDIYIQGCGGRREIHSNKGLAGLMDRWRGAWCIFGDLNVVRSSEDRLNSQVNIKEMCEFNEFINDARLMEILIGGRRFTKVSDAGMKLSKLDRFLLNDDFYSIWGNLSIIALDHKLSDHCPIVLKDVDLDFGPKPIRIFNIWMDESDFRHVTEEAWKKEEKIEGLKKDVMRWELEAKNRVLNEVERNTWLEHENGGRRRKINTVICSDKKKKFEGLNAIVSEEMENGVFRGVKVGENNVTVYHLQYADDTIFFGEWNKYNASIGVDEMELNYMAGWMGCGVGDFPFTYLGIPVGEDMSRINAWNVVVDRFKSRLADWKDKTMSFGWRLTSVKTVLDSRKEGRVWDKGSRVNDVWVLNWEWVKSIRGRVVREYEEFLGVVQNIVVEFKCRDKWRWMLGEDGEITVKGLARLAEEKALCVEGGHHETILNNLVPKKVNIFLWRALKGRLPVHVELDRRGIDLDSVLCPCCIDIVEMCSHSLITCDLAMSVWDKIFNWWKVGRVNAFTIEEIFSYSRNVNIPTSLARVWKAVIWTCGYFIWKKRNARVFETYVKAKDLDLWHIILNGDFPPVAKNEVTQILEVVPFEEQFDDLKKKLAKNNEAKMVLYNALPKKKYERIFMCKTAKDIWQSLLITHQGNSQRFARFNTIITSLKALDKGFSSKNYVRKFLRALHPKWREKVTTIEESKDFSSLALDELIGNLKVHEVVMEKDSEIYRGKKERIKSIALKAKKESSDDETLTSGSDEEEYAMAIRKFKKFFRRKDKFVRQPREEKKSFRQRDEKKIKSDQKCFRCGDPNHLIGDYPKPSRNKDQKAFIGGSWSDSENDAEDKTNDETYLMVQSSNEVTLNSSYYSDKASSLDNDIMQVEYDSLCEISLKIINKNKFLKTKRGLLEKEILELNEKIKKLERGKKLILRSYMSLMINLLLPPTAITNCVSVIEPLNGTNFSSWKEQVKNSLSITDLDYALRFDKPNPLTATSTVDEKRTYEIRERSNRMSLMIMKNSISVAIRGAIPDSENAKEFLKSVEEQFKGSSKANASTLILKMLTTKYDGLSGVREHIMMMNDMASKLKGMDMEISEGFLVHFIMTSLPAQFSPFKINYNTQKEKWKMSELIAMCVQEEERLKIEQPETLLT